MKINVFKSTLIALFLLVLLVPYFKVIGQVVQQENKNNSLIIVATVDTEIKEGTVKYLRRVINFAEDKRADYLIIKLHTPGGLLTATESIVSAIQESDVPVIVFIYREAGWGYSAGTFILMAADIAAMHPYALIGAAQPAIMGSGIEKTEERQFLAKQENEEKDEEEEKEQPKIVEAMAKWMGSLAEVNQRNSEIAEKFVRDNLTLRGREALEYGVIEYVAFDLDELLEKLEIEDPEIIFLGLSLAEKLFNFLSHPFVIPLFLIFSFLGIVVAIQTREIEIGVIALIPLLIGIWGLGIIEFNILSLFLIFFGLILLTIELLAFAGFGLLGIGGIIAVFIGMIGFGAEPFLQPAWHDALFITSLIITIIGCILFIIISRAAIKALRAKPHTGIESLIGKIVIVVDELNPEGQIIDKGEIWTAESIDKKTIPEKIKVKIEKVEGNKVYVALP